MRLTFIVIYLGFMVSARKHESTSDESTSDKSTSDEYYSSHSTSSTSYGDSYEDRGIIVDGHLNLKGGVRGGFALEAALKDHATNMICSPLSVMMPLGKLAMGAGRRTEKELFKAVHVFSKDQLTQTFAQIITNLEFLPGVTLDMANRIYVSTKNEINKKFANNAKFVFKSSCEKITTSDPKKTANTINGWVAEKTRNRIKHLINSRDISEDTSLIIVNAVYFSAKWLNKFEKTFTDDFFSPAGRQRLPMMSRTGRYRYWKCDTLNAEIVEIPYEGSSAAMIVVLPYKTNDLGHLLRQLKKKPDLLNSALQKMKITDIVLQMPKFKIESEMDLKDIYKKIGVKTIFDDNADLKGIIEDETVYVTKAIHKATIEVTERGTEASAATALQGHGLSASAVSAARVKVNHPFLFYIRAYKEQLFAGIFNGNENDQSD